MAFEAVNKILQGGSSTQLNQKIKTAVQHRMLVPNNDFEPLERDDYVSTPILKSMRVCPRTLGVIYVACVPSGKGKTMACYAFLKKYAQGKAIAFSPPANEQTYLENILYQLNLDAETGTGFVNALINELNEGATIDKPSYLIFDDFMPYGPNKNDGNLLMQLKTRLRGKNIYCIILTRNQNAANYSLSRNELASIQPLVNNDAFRVIKSQVVNGGRHNRLGDALQHEVGRRRETFTTEDFTTKDFTIDWETHCNMMWDNAVMKRSIMLLPDYSKMPPEQKATVENAIDNYLEEEMLYLTRYYLTISDVLAKIRANVNIPPTPANNTATTPTALDPDRCICCFKSPLAPRRGFFE